MQKLIPPPFFLQLNFVRMYLKTLGKEGTAEEERLMNDIKIFALASDLFWGLWSVVNAKLSEIPFGYWVSPLIPKFFFLYINKQN